MLFLFLPTFYLEFGSRTTLILKKLYHFNLRLWLFCALLFLCQTNLALLSPWYPDYFLVCIYRQQLKPFIFLVLQNWTRWMIVLFPCDCNDPLHLFLFTPLKMCKDTEPRIWCIGNTAFGMFLCTSGRFQCQAENRGLKREVFSNLLIGSVLNKSKVFSRLYNSFVIFCNILFTEEDSDEIKIGTACKNSGCSKVSGSVAL